MLAMEGPMTPHPARLAIAAAMTAFAAGIVALGAAAQSAPMAEPAGTGLWQKNDAQTGKPIGWFLIVEQNGLYQGAIAKMFLDPGDPQNQTCSSCRDDRKDEPL